MAVNLRRRPPRRPLGGSEADAGATFGKPESLAAILAAPVRLRRAASARRCARGADAVIAQRIEAVATSAARAGAVDCRSVHDVP